MILIGPEKTRAELKMDLNKETEQVKKNQIRWEEFNRWNKKYTGGNEQQTRGCRRIISDLEDTVKESTQTEQQKEERIKRNENRVREFRDSIKSELQESQKEKTEKKSRKLTWRDIRRKLPQLGEGNCLQGPVSTESSKRDEPEEVHTKSHHN